MSRVINPDGAGKQRTQLIRSIVLTLRALAQRPAVDGETRDMVAFIVLALRRVNATIDVTVAAWEKRDYWLKADQFRLQWQWTGLAADRLEKSLRAEDWPGVGGSIPALAEKLATVKLPKRNTLGQPWMGAYKALTAK